MKQGHNSNADHEFVITGGDSTETYGSTAKTANIGAAIRQIPNHFMLENTIQKTSEYLF